MENITGIPSQTPDNFNSIFIIESTAENNCPYKTCNMINLCECCKIDNNRKQSILVNQIYEKHYDKVKNSIWKGE